MQTCIAKEQFPTDDCESMKGTENMKPLTVFEREWINNERLKLEGQIVQEEEGTVIKALLLAVYALYLAALEVEK